MHLQLLLAVLALSMTGCATGGQNLSTEQDTAAAAACGALLDQPSLTPEGVSAAKAAALKAGADQNYMQLADTFAAISDMPTQRDLDSVRSQCAEAIPGHG